MPEIPDDWPIWATLLFLILSQFRGILAKILPNAWRSHQEHEQEIEEIQLNAHLQTVAGEQLRKSWRDEQFLELLQAQQAFIQELLILEIKTQGGRIDRMQQEIRSLRRAVLRVGDITALMSTQSKATFKLSEEINGLINSEGD